MRYELRAMSIGAILDRALRILLRSFGLLLAISLVFAVPLAILYLYLAATMGTSGERTEIEDMQRNLLATLIGVPLQFTGLALVQGALMQAVSDIYLGTPAAFGRSFRLAFSRFLPIIGGLIVTSMVIGGGTLLCIVPGLIFLAAFFATIPIIVLEKKGPIDAMARSWKLTEGNRRRIFAGVFFAQMVAGLIGGTASGICGALNVDPLLTHAATQTAQAILQPYTAIVIILLYYDVRVRREAFDLQILAREIGQAPAPAATPP